MQGHIGIRIFWLVIGLIALALGIIGYILPLLPGTVFLLVAAFAFARSSPRLSGWLQGHPRFGPLITDWQDHGAIRPRTKLAAMIMIAATPLISWLIGASLRVLLVQGVVLTLVSMFILTRPNGPKAGNGTQ